MPEAPVPTARDGSPLPDPSRPTYERDVRAMFAHIAEGYEWFDHVASLGQDFLWRPRALWAVDRFRTPGVPVRRILDLGCGTGELSRLCGRRYPGAAVVGADFTGAMLRAAARAERARGPATRFARATAMRLPFRDASFDLVVSAFVARNLPDLPRALREMRRVVAPDGTVLVLDITGPSAPAVRRLFLAYFGHVVPWLGAAVGSEGPYTHLPRSLAYLPTPAGFVAACRDAGFGSARAVPISGGIVTVFLAGPSPDRQYR